METVRVSGLTHPHPFLEVPQELLDADGRGIRLTQWNPQARIGADVQVSLQGEIETTRGIPNFHHPLDCGDGRVIVIQAGGLHYRGEYTPKHGYLTPSEGSFWVISVTGWLEVPATWLWEVSTDAGGGEGL